MCFHQTRNYVCVASSVRQISVTENRRRAKNCVYVPTKPREQLKSRNFYFNNIKKNNIKRSVSVLIHLELKTVRVSFNVCVYRSI